MLFIYLTYLLFKGKLWYCIFLLMFYIVFFMFYIMFYIFVNVQNPLKRQKLAMCWSICQYFLTSPSCLQHSSLSSLVQAEDLNLLLYQLTNNRVSYLKNAQWIPKAARDRSFLQTFLKQEETVHLSGTIFSSSLILTLSISSRKKSSLIRENLISD